MASKICEICGRNIVADSSELGRKFAEHMQKEHVQGYRRSDSWFKCKACGGSGKTTWGGQCPQCHGSGEV